MTELLKSPAAMILAALTMLALLVSLTVVMQGIAQRSSVRHRAEAEQARSRWQCAAMLQRVHRDNCQLQLASAKR